VNAKRLEKLRQDCPVKCGPDAFKCFCKEDGVIPNLYRVVPTDNSPEAAEKLKKFFELCRS
jgi:hypothetical protein